MKINQAIRHRAAPINMPQNNFLLFVYGTLRRDCPTGAHKQYLQGAEFVSKAKAHGELFLVDYYPGFCLPKQVNHTNAAAWVIGEVYSLQNDHQLEKLDRYEGCTSDSPEPHEYTRALIEVILPDHQILTVWTYVYKGDTNALTFLPSGDFLQPF